MVQSAIASPWVLALGLVWLCIDILATRAILRDEFSSFSQQFALLAIVWLLPFAGGLLTLYFYRALSATPSAGKPAAGAGSGDSGGADGTSND